MQMAVCVLTRINIKMIVLATCVFFYTVASAAIHRIPTVTLLVKNYSELENQLQDALQKRDSIKIESLLAGDFEERNGKNPNRPIPRKEWIKQHHPKVNLKEMAVRGLGQIRIVSFLETVDKKNKTIFIVDVWKNNELLARYSS